MKCAKCTSKKCHSEGQNCTKITPENIKEAYQGERLTIMNAAACTEGRHYNSFTRLEETAAANAQAVKDQQQWAENVDDALEGWRVQRDAQDKKTAELRQQREAARHDETFSAWADRPLPDAAVRLLQTGAAH